MVITDLNVENIEPFLKKHAKSPIVIMFYGETCGPCKATMPHYESLAQKLADDKSKIKFARYHNWENQEHRDLSKKWDVQGVPGFRMFYNGSVIARREGGGAVEVLENYLEAGMYIHTVLKSMEQ